MRPLIALAVSLLLSLPAGAADAVADLLALAPKDTTFALVVRDLRGHVKRLDESPFAAWFPDSRLGKALLASPEWNTLTAAEKIVTQQLGVTADDLIDGLLGDAVVFAYRSQDDSGLTLFRAAKPDLLAKVIDRLNAAQTKAGEVKAVREKRHNGATYHERDRGGRSEFYWVRGGTLAFSSTEATVREAIDRAAKPAPAPLADAVAKLQLTTAVVAGVFQPRALDADLAAAAKGAENADQRAFLTQFQKVWAACEAVAVSVEFGANLDVAVNVKLDPKALPVELKPLLLPGVASALWSAIPADALLGVAGKLDVPALLDAMRPFLSDAGQGGLKVLLDDRLGPIIGKNKMPALMVGLGPDIGFWVTAPEKGEKGWTPVATLAVKVGDPAAKKDEVGPPLVSALDAVAQLVRYEYNRTHDDQIELKTDAAPAGDVKSLANDALFPAGVRPAYGLRHGYLVVSTSDAAVKAFKAPAAPLAGAAGLYARASLLALGKYLAAHRAEITAGVAKLNGAKPAELEAEFARFGEVLELFDAVELRRSGTDGRIRLSLSVKTAKPLAK